MLRSTAEKSASSATSSRMRGSTSRKRGAPSSCRVSVEVESRVASCSNSSGLRITSPTPSLGSSAAGSASPPKPAVSPCSRKACASATRTSSSSIQSRLVEGCRRSSARRPGAQVSRTRSSSMSWGNSNRSSVAGFIQILSCVREGPRLPS